MSRPASQKDAAEGASKSQAAWAFGPTSTALDAAHDLTHYLRHRLDTRKVRILEALKFTPHSWVFSARINGEKVVIKRFFTDDPAHTVRSLKGELDRLETIFGTGDCQANRCLAAWPEDGVAVLSFAPGTRLDLKIAKAKGQARVKLLAHSGRWLATYTTARRRDATFGPGYWIKRSSARDHSAINAEDQALLDQLITALHHQNDRVKGCPVLQAASHGDYVGMNAHYHRGVICGVDIQGEYWGALAREAARFLVWQQIHDADRPTNRTHGLLADDMHAFLSSGVLPAPEHATSFPFFVGEQLYGRFVEDYRRTDIRENARAAITAYLAQHRSS